MDRKLKILKLKYEYLKLELEDVRDDFEKYTTDFDKYFDKYYKKAAKIENTKNQKEFENPATHFENAKKEREKQQRKLDEQRELLRDAPKKVKNLYKRLAAKTHPDKLGGKHQEFQSVKEAYEKQDLGKMLELAAEYEVDYNMDKNDEILLTRNLRELENEINRIKDTIGWLWGKGNKSQRQFCVQRVEEETKLKIRNVDLPPDLRKQTKKLLKGKSEKK